jgi:Na+/melibiose symporter-like transporter
VERLELEYTPGADSPLGAGVCGAFLVLLGLPLAVLLLPRSQDLEMFFVCCFWSFVAGIGAWTLWFAIRKRYVLVAYTPSGSSRMIFHRPART